VKAKPAVACTLPLAATFSDRANASHTLPRSIAAHPPPAAMTLPRASAGLAAINNRDRAIARTPLR